LVIAAIQQKEARNAAASALTIQGLSNRCSMKLILSAVPSGKEPTLSTCHLIAI